MNNLPIPNNSKRQVASPLPKYTLSEKERKTFERIWKSEIQFFQEVPWRNEKHYYNAKRFAARVYYLAVQEHELSVKESIKTNE